jgi:hypothetical protein
MLNFKFVAGAGPFTGNWYGLHETYIRGEGKACLNLHALFPRPPPHGRLPNNIKHMRVLQYLDQFCATGARTEPHHFAKGGVTRQIFVFLFKFFHYVNLKKGVVARTRATSFTESEPEMHQNVAAPQHFHQGKVVLVAEVGIANFFLSPLIANPLIFF